MQREFRHCAVMLWLLAIVPFQQATAAMITVQPSALSVVPGQEFAVNFAISDATDVYAFQLDVGFNPNRFMVVDTSEGSFLAAGGPTLFSPGTINNTTGAVDFIGSTLQGLVPGVSGDGNLATVNFRALSAGVGAITLTNATLFDSNLAPLDVIAVQARPVTVIPEPSTLLGLLSGLFFVAGVRCIGRRPMVWRGDHRTRGSGE
jgi:hypothetical protein